MTVSEIIEESFEAISRSLGINSAIKFTELIRATNGGQDLSLEKLPETEQIKLINIFWRKQLLVIPGTTGIRAWLCEGDSIAAYITAFEKHWVHDLQVIGLL